MLRLPMTRLWIIIMTFIVLPQIILYRCDPGIVKRAFFRGLKDFIQQTNQTHLSQDDRTTRQATRTTEKLQTTGPKTTQESFTPTPRPTRDRLNVLLIIADDLRPEISPYDHPDIHTPNLQRLAQRSLVLSRAYTQYSLCAPSRTSFLTGRRPDTTKVWDLVTYWRLSGGDFTTLPQFFKDSGYVTAGTGKVFHGGTSAHHFDPPSWSFRYKRPKSANFWNLATIKDSWRAVTEAERFGKPLPDEEITMQATSYLRQFQDGAKAGTQPFFLGVGFHKPHLPFVFPSEYLDMYPFEQVELPENDFVPENFPPAAFHTPGEILNFHDIKAVNFSGAFNESLPVKSTLLLRRAYRACISYIDSKVGEVLKTLEELGMSESTLVVFIGDHGWHLGENGHWGKHTNFELGTRAPMLIHIPGRTDAGGRSDSLVEFVDLFPTIVEAAGLESIPVCPRNSSGVNLCTDGRSFLGLVDDPRRVHKNASFSQMHRKPGLMGYSLRNERYRYTEWAPLQLTQQQDGLYHYSIQWEGRVGTELYDHSIDPAENHNKATEETYAEICKALSHQLHEQISDQITGAQTVL